MNRPAPPTETIAAIATAPGRGAVGILRLSGPQSGRIAEALCGVLPPPRQAALRHFRDATGQALDQGLVLVFPAPRSFTGEDVVELQGHGGPAVLNLLLAAACAACARPARPGEFSERAFLNGRMDLAQAEAVADLIGAASAQAARAASRALDGALSKQVDALLEELTALRVFVEGALDFSDQDTPWLEDAALHQRFAALRSRLQQLLREADQGRRLRDGLVITLTGAPNVGKSTLMNRLAGADVAIVTDQPGTTRDTLREDLDLDGLPVTLVDTAGLRDSDDPIEREGMRRARAAAARADLALFLLDDRSGLGSAERALAASLAPGPRLLFVHNKCDISGRAAGVFEQNGERHLRVSAAHGDGIDRLRAEIRAAAGLDSHGEGLFSARARHVDALRRTLDSVDAALHRIREGAHAELAAEELRLAQAALGEITGRFSSEDLLGAIFRSFCIGK
jgi:tRNA modification GTPase